MDPNNDTRFLGRSVTSLQTMLRVIALQDESCPMVIPDGIYGEQTAKDILKYHRAYEVDSRLMSIKNIITLIDEI